jgi:hypothetical protein
MDFDRIPQMFHARFPTGGFTSNDFRPHIDGYVYQAWIVIEPKKSEELTRTLAYAKLAEMCDWLRPLHCLFGPNDRVAFLVGFPESVKESHRRVFKGWIPASALALVNPPDFAAVGGGFGENPFWSGDLWTESVNEEDIGGS